jgi:hypothetical protein
MFVFEKCGGGAMKTPRREERREETAGERGRGAERLYLVIIADNWS